MGACNPHPKRLIRSWPPRLEKRRILLHVAGPLESTREVALDREGTGRPETGRLGNPIDPGGKARAASIGTSC